MEKIDRAIGSILGLFVGDAFGAQTEFDMEEDLSKEFPCGILEMDSRERNIGEAGAVTDDSEMAIMLASSIIDRKKFDARDVRRRYIAWLNAEPSDLGTTIYKALREGEFDAQSQANGALMRVAPIGILGCNLDEQEIIRLSDEDCALTHKHSICKDANRIWALAIAKAVRDGDSKEDVYAYMRTIAPRISNDNVLTSTLDEACNHPPQACDGRDQGWVLIALHQAIYTLLHSGTIEEGIRAITMRGGDADTNAAIYAMLAGAIDGSTGIPHRWISSLKPTRCLEDLFPDQPLDMVTLAKDLALGLVSM